MKKESVEKLVVVGIYAIAMAFLETAVVVYLRALFYPNGFNFPLVGYLDPVFLNVEWIREFATIIMLLTIGYLSAKKFYPKFAYFLYAFAIWDNFYYVFLKLTLNWPASFLSWDLLFMIPWPWVGPVFAPVVCSFLFIVLAIIIINFYDNKKEAVFSWKEFSLFGIAVLVVLYTWMIDYALLIFQKDFALSFFTLNENLDFIKLVSSYSPNHYNWFLFFIGILLVLIGIVSFYYRNKKPKL